MAQLDKVRSAGQVEIAAPIAMLGYSRSYLEQAVDLTGQLDPAARSQLLRLTPGWIADRGLTVLNDAPQYAYVTRNPVLSRLNPGDRYTDGTLPSERMRGCYSAFELREDGSRNELCLYRSDLGGDGTSPQERTLLQVYALGPDGRFVDANPVAPRPPSDRLVINISWDVMVLAAAIDPAAEAALVDLDKSVVSGRYLSTSDQPEMRVVPGSSEGFTKRYLGVPALVASTPYVDEQVRVAVERMGAEWAAVVSGKTHDDWVAALAAAPGTPSGRPGGTSASPQFANEVQLAFMYQSGAARYVVGENTGALYPQPIALAPELWQVPLDDNSGRVIPYQPPVFALDNGFRPVSRVGAIGGDQPETDRVGEFDPGRLRGFSPLSAVPTSWWTTWI